MLTAEQQRLDDARQGKLPWKKWDPSSVSGSGARSARTIAKLVMLGISSRTIRLVRVPIAGVKTASPASLMTNSISASHWPYGTARIRFSRSGFSD